MPAVRVGHWRRPMRPLPPPEARASPGSPSAGPQPWLPAQQCSPFSTSPVLKCESCRSLKRRRRKQRRLTDVAIRTLPQVQIGDTQPTIPPFHGTRLTRPRIPFRPLTLVTRVRIPCGAPLKVKRFLRRSGNDFDNFSQIFSHIAD